MIRLIALGTLDIQRPNGRSIQSILHQPKRLALLTYVALAERGTFRSRDTVLAMFWPESDAEHARGALNQALHVLRRSLGPGVIVSRGPDEIGVAGGALWCDAAAFQAAVEDGDDGGALALYRGDLLAGFYVDGAPGFERWLEEERRRLKRLASGAAWRLAERAEEEGNGLGAVEWARRAVDLSEGEELLVRRLIELMDRVGDRAGALEAFESFAERLAEEYEAKPSAETQQLIARVRSRASPLAAASPAPTTEPRAAARLPAAAEDPVFPEPGADAPLDREVLWREPRRRAWGAWPAGAAGLAVLLLVAWFASRRPGATLPDAIAARQPVVAITRLVDLSENGELAHVAGGVTAAVVSHLDALDGLKVIPAEEMDRLRVANESMAGAASRLNVLSVVRGNLLRSGDLLRIAIELVDARSGETLNTAVVERPYGELFALIDALSHEIASLLRVQIGREVRLRLWQAGTDDIRAWELVQHAERDRERAREIQWSGAGSVAATYLEKADSLLVLAEAAAPDWVEPTLRRGEVASDAAWLYFLPPVQDLTLASAQLRQGIGHAERALVREPRRAGALELRGKLEYWTWLMMPLSPESAAALLRSAEADLRSAIAIEPGRARAWSLLSALLFARAEFAEAHWAAARAYEADIFLDGVDEILGRLFATSFEIGDDEAARRWCAEIRRRIADGWAAAYCVLRLMAWLPGSQAAAPDEAWRVVMRGTAGSGAGHPMRPRLETLAAAVLARAGMPDSAEAVLRRTAAQHAADPELLHLEASARLILGQPDSATALLARYASVDPAGAPSVLLSRRFAPLRRELRSIIRLPHGQDR